MKRSILLALLISIFFAANTSAKKKTDKTDTDTVINSSLVNSLSFRNIGPAWASGRIADFAVNPKNPSEYYVAVASGNVWKTTNNGTTWKPVFDNYGAYSIGIVKLDPNNSNVVWIGTGENNHQRALGYGDGVYKSVDGGKSFKNMGLKDSRHIGGIVVDPRNSDIVMVACEGSSWGPGGDRGLFKTIDGGKTWEKTLSISENTGVNNVIIDPNNPDILYATSEQRRRHQYGKIGGGPESAVYKSTDNGNTWRKITKGLPGVDKGGMGIALSPVNSNILFLIVEAAENKSGFYRSTDAGESWNKMSDHASSGQYYNEIYCDPVDVDKVFSVETYTQYTEDAGKTWKRLSNNKRHVDDHALWINPKNTNHILIGGDGGIYESYDMGTNWDFKENLPITQFYRVAVDNAAPFYNIYGGTQDNNSMGGPSRNDSRSGVTNDEWIVTLGGDGFCVAIDPKDPNTVYTEYQYGNMFRFDKKTGERISIKPRERKDELAYKWNWNTPLFLSPHANTTLYCAANKVFKSTDKGQSWEVISEDLTEQKNRDELKFMDKYWSSDAVAKHVSTSQWGTIVSLDESRVQKGLIYAGSDDGVISISNNDGKSWTQIHASSLGIPEYTYVSDIQADKFDANIVYVTFDNLKRDDFKPYVFKSVDQGKTWVSISSNLPKNQTIHSIQQDYIKPELLFVGSEFGVFFSINGGEKWVQLKAGIPTIAVKDITIQERESDLVLASFGRGFFVLDNYAPLRELSQAIVEKEAHLFDIKDALMFVPRNSRSNQGSTYFFAKNPEYGATFNYYLKDVPKTKKAQRKAQEKDLLKKGEYIPQPEWRDMELESKEEQPHLIFTIYNNQDEAIRTINSSATKGMKKINWDLRLPSPYATSTDKFDPTKKGRSGWPVVPGTYKVDIKLWANGTLKTLVDPKAFTVKKLYKHKLSQNEKMEIDAFNTQIMTMVKTINGTENLIKELTKEIATLQQTIYALDEAPETLMDQARALSVQLEELNFKMQGVPAKASWEEIPPAQMPISVRAGQVAYARYASSGAVTGTEKEVMMIVKEEIQPVLASLKDIATNKIPALEGALDELGAPWTSGRVPIWNE